MSKEAVQTKVVNEIAIDGFDHVELFVSNALHASYYFNRGLGFDIVGYRGPETGSRDAVSYLLKQDHVHIVLTGALNSKNEVASHVHEHGDGVKCIAFRVKDAKLAYETALARGAKSASDVRVQKDESGEYVTASIKTYGDTIHTFIERTSYKGTFAPGFQAMNKPAPGKVGLAAVDHVVGAVEEARMADWVNFYSSVFGFGVTQSFGLNDISTKYSALLSDVVANKSGSVKLPLIEPSTGLKKSQVQEYLDYYHSPGVQHIAIATRDIVQSVAELRKRGIDFLTVPRSYYDMLPDRVGKIDEDIEQLAELGVLVDREEEGYLLQIFTRPVEDRPTMFLEIIQRKGAKGFGKGNFQALFESIEREQALRGNL